MPAGQRGSGVNKPATGRFPDNGPATATPAKRFLHQVVGQFRTTDQTQQQSRTQFAVSVQSPVPAMITLVHFRRKNHALPSVTLLAAEYLQPNGEKTPRARVEPMP